MGSEAQVSSFASKAVICAQRMDGCPRLCALRHGTTEVSWCMVAPRRITMEAGACTMMDQIVHGTRTGLTHGLIARGAVRSRSCDCPERIIYRFMDCSCACLQPRAHAGKFFRTMMQMA